MKPAPANASDFVARFPAGATIGAGEKQYISIGGAECFRTACGPTGNFLGFGVYPTYELASSTAATALHAIGSAKHGDVVSIAIFDCDVG